MAECLDRLVRWQVTPCLCDCHYTGRECAGDVRPRGRRTLVRDESPADDAEEVERKALYRQEMLSLLT